STCPPTSAATSRSYASKCIGGECVAFVRVARLVARAEPALTLLRRPVRPRLPIDAAGGGALDAVVTDRGGGIEAVTDVGGRDPLDQRGVDRVGGPDAGVAVCLQLEPHRRRRRT